MQNISKIVIGFFVTSFLFRCSMPQKKYSAKNNEPEGYVTFNNKLFQDVDSNGFAISPAQGNDSLFFYASREMFIYKNYLIDIQLNQNYNNGVYLRTDTIGYIFHDLAKQKFVNFQTLSINALVIKRGEMADNGSFSIATKYDPLNGVPDSSLKKTNILVNDKSNVIAEFVSTYSSDDDLVRKVKFWIDPNIVNFPLQLSYLLSKNKKMFVYKRQMPISEKQVIVTSLKYKPALLPDSLIAVFKKWAKILDSNK